MNKIAFVVQRYGLDVNGGAEYHCRVLAEHMTVLYRVDVLTSCARSYTPWDNFYLSGVERLNDVNVYRFPVENIVDSVLLDNLSRRFKSGDREVEEQWLQERGPYCPALIAFLEANADAYEAIIFFTYDYYPTVKGISLHLKNSILIPTAHDEPLIYYPIYEDVFRSAKAILYNSVEEKEFVIKQFRTDTKPSRLTCVGIDIPNDTDELPQRLQEYQDNYIVYVGRVSKSKNFCELNRDFIEYKKRNPSSLKLLVVGKIDEQMPLLYSEDIIYAGFVSDSEKTAIIKNAKLLVMPSLYESLSLVILESMAVRRPILVNGRCAVLKGQCIRSNAGLYYTNYFEFEACLNYMLSKSDEYTQMCDNGYRFVTEVYDWNQVVQNVNSLIKEIVASTV